MGAQHTPGPWEPMAGMPTNILGSKMYRIARCDFDGDFNHPEAHANARLIAAAPDLLAALEPFVLANSSEEFVTLVVRSIDITKARAAIAKARGEA